MPTFRAARPLVALVLALGLAPVAIARGVPALAPWAPFPEGTVVDAAERGGALGALLLDGEVLRFALEPAFAPETVSTGVGEGLAPELAWDRRWTARYCRGGAERIATRGRSGWAEGPGFRNPACEPFERIDGVMTAAAAGLDAGTLVTVLPTAEGAAAGEGAPNEAGAAAGEARVRTREGVEATVPRAAVARAVGLQLRADLEGDGELDTVVTLVGEWPSEEGIPTRSSQIGVLSRGRVRLSEPVVTPCGGTPHSRLRILDATTDGRFDVLAVRHEDVCEVGWLGDHLEVYNAALARLADTVAPAWPQVGPVRAGRVAWWPGGVRVTAVSGEGSGALVRSRAELAWVDENLVGRGSSSGPVTVRLGRDQEPVQAMSGGGPVVTPSGSHAVDTVEFLDRELALDALGASGQPPRVVRSLD